MPPTPPRPLSTSTGFLLAWVASYAQRAYEAELEQIGLTAQQVGALTLIAAEPQKQARLAAQLGIFSAHMVQVINALQSRSLVKRVPHPDDRRAVLVQLTADGERLLRRAATISDQVTAATLEPLTSAEQATFTSLLRRLAGLEASR